MIGGGTAQKLITGGIRMNKIEELKSARDGLLIMEDLKRFAAGGYDSIPEDDMTRLRWAGLFARNTTPGHFMLRVRVPAGVLEAQQWKTLGKLAESYGRSIMDITTRQGVQLRWIRIEDAPAIFARLAAVGLSPLQTGHDNARNVMSCPVAGLDPREWADVQDAVRAVNSMIVGNREFSNLPRKFNIAITGCPDDCGHSEINDIGVVPVHAADGRVRFCVRVGGALGPTYHRIAEWMPGSIARREIAPVCRAILELYRDFGPRDKRHKARLFHLLDRWGMERFASLVRKRSGVSFDSAPVVLPHGAQRRDHIGIYRERDSLRAYVGLLVPVGSITAQQWLAIGNMAARYGTGQVRLTAGQNIVVPHIHRSELDAFLAEDVIVALSPMPNPFLRGTVSCTGKQFCDKAIIETKQVARAIADHLDHTVEASERPLHIHWSGCPNSCGQHQVADIGLQGTKVRLDGRMTDAVDIHLGGAVAPEGSRVYRERVPVSELPEVMRCLVEGIMQEQRDGTPPSAG